MDVIVTRKRVEAVDICSFELASKDGAGLPAFSAGAHIDVHLKPSLTRQYSLCNHPDEQHRYMIGVLRDPSSRGGSIAMHDTVNEGDVLSISEPRNHFPLERGAKRSLLFAGGIGVTPILCMAERLAQIGADFEMHYCTRSPERMAFREHIASKAFADRVRFHFDDQAPEQKLDAPAVLAHPEPETHVYVCGPTGFMTWVLDTAKRAGWPDAQVHREYFASAPVDSASDRAFEVKIASSGQVIPVAADQTIVAALAAHGVDIMVSCEQGVCGTCLTRVLEGEPDHRDVYLTDEEHAKNDEFTPCCSRSKSAVLVLDL
jgi:vanillate O-demethylase ferredoxin subunit